MPKQIILDSEAALILMLAATKEYAQGAGIDARTHRRWCRMLVLRACRFYIEGHLDSACAEEDLYQEDGEFCNLDTSEPHENEFILDTIRENR